jgi:hypothetical protein
MNIIIQVTFWIEIADLLISHSIQLHRIGLMMHTHMQV